jgi:hypothetical protein
MLLDSIIPVERNVLAFRTTLDKLRQLGTDFDSMLFSICPNGFLVFNTSIWHSKVAGSWLWARNRQHMFSTLVMRSYRSSDSSLVVWIVVDLAKLILYNSGALVEQRYSRRVSMLDLQQQWVLGGQSGINAVLDGVITMECMYLLSVTLSIDCDNSRRLSTWF